MPLEPGEAREGFLEEESAVQGLSPTVLSGSLASLWESQTCLVAVGSWGVSWGALWPAFQATLTGGDFLLEVMRVKECKRRVTRSRVPRGGSPWLRVEEDT